MAPSPSSPVPAWLQVLLPLVQVSFYVATGVAAGLSLWLAWRTLKQPARTEVFKMQIESLGRVLAEFVGKGDYELSRDSAFSELQEINILAAFDQYRRVAFGEEIDMDDRPYAPRLCPRLLVKREALELADHSVEPEAGERGASRDIPPWADYKHLVTPLPPTYCSYEARIRNLLSDPMLPVGCVALLDDYLSTLAARVAVVADVIDEAVPEFPKHYPTLDLAQRAAPNWLQARITARVDALAVPADAITDFIRSYLGTDSIYRRRAMQSRPSSSPLVRIRAAFAQFRAGPSGKSAPK